MYDILKRNWKLLVMLVLVMVIILQRQCKHCPDIPEPGIISHTDTITLIDTVWQWRDSKPVTNWDTLEIPTFVDTAGVITEFYRKKVYNDTISDSNFTVLIRDTVTRNRITNRHTETSKYFPVHYIHTIDSIFYSNECPKARNKFYVGFAVGGWDNKFSVAPGVALNTKKDNLYLINYDVVNQVAQIHSYWKIRAKK